MAVFNQLLLYMILLYATRCQAQEVSITVTPQIEQQTLFEGAEFRRVCSVMNMPADARTMFLRNGLLVKTSTTSDNLQLLLSGVTVNDTGSYECVVTLLMPGGSVATLGSASAGSLTVLGLDLLNAPAVQVGLEGQNFSLVCSYMYPGTFINWYHDNDPSPSTFSPLRVRDEGEYMCEVVVLNLQGPPTSKLVRVQLMVKVPVMIVAHTQPLQQSLTSNQPLTLFIHFTGRITHNLTVTWFHDATPLSSDPRIITVLASTLSTSTLMIPLALRADAGLYRVVVSSDVLGLQRSSQEFTFQVDVQVLPAGPDNFVATQISSTTSLVVWTMANQTLDQRADSLTLHLSYRDNGTLVWSRDLPGDRTSELLEGLIPATNYSLQMVSRNVDGQILSGPYHFTTLVGPPLLISVWVTCLNHTHFDILAYVAYTGGGLIRTMLVVYGEQGNKDILGVESVPGSKWQATLIVEEKEDFRKAVQLTVSVGNEYELQSNQIMTGCASVGSSSTTSSAITLDPGPGQGVATVDLPVWLIAVIASALTVLIAAGLVVCGILCYIWHKRSPRASFKVTPPLPSADLNDLKDKNNGDSLPRTSVYSPQHSDGGSLEDYRSRSQSESLPSTIDVLTPTMEKTHHKRVPSDCSSGISINKLTLTPSTTASNSPSNLIKIPYTSHDKGLGSIIEIVTSHHGSDDSGTENERERVRQLRQKGMHISPRAQHNQINADLHRAPGDGSPCDSPSAQHLNQYGSAQFYPHIINISDSGLGYNVSSLARPTGGAEYAYSDCESVASTDISCGNSSIPPHYIRHQRTLEPHHRGPGLKPVQFRTATPFNTACPPDEQESLV